MSRQPQISFVIPSHNYGRYILDCLSSILKQDATDDYEIVIVDDASTDDSVAIINTIDDPRIRLTMHQENLGHIATVNHAFSLARGAFIARIDPDDRYRLSFLERTMNVFEKHEDVVAVYADVALIDDHGRVTQGRTHSRHSTSSKGSEYLALLEANFISQAAVIARRAAWESGLPIPNGMVLDDVYLMLHAARTGPFFYIHEVLGECRIHGSNLHYDIVRTKSEERAIDHLLKTFFAVEEENPEIDATKSARRGAVYANQYFVLGEKYFGQQMFSDARRCYLRVLRHRPSYLFHQRLLPHALGTLMGSGLYERSKSVIRRGSAKSLRRH